MSGKTFRTVSGGVPPIRVVSFVRTCIACPSQWGGTTDDGRNVYARYRYSHGDVRVSALGEHGEFAGVNGTVVCEWEREGYDPTNGLDGDLTEDELRTVTMGLVEWPAELSVTLSDSGPSSEETR